MQISLKKIIYLLFLCFAVMGAKGNCQQLQNSISSGTSNSLNVSINNTFGVTTSANHNSNMVSVNEAVLVLEPGSSISDNVGGDTNSLSADFMISPNGTSTSIQGISNSTNMIFGSGTSFSSSLRSIENQDPTIPSRGNASAGIQLSLSINVDQQNSSFSNSFSNAF